MNKNKSVILSAYFIELSRSHPPLTASPRRSFDHGEATTPSARRSRSFEGCDWFFFLKKTDQSSFISKPIHFLMECMAPGFIVIFIIRSWMLLVCDPHSSIDERISFFDICPWFAYFFCHCLVPLLVWYYQSLTLVLLTQTLLRATI